VPDNGTPKTASGNTLVKTIVACVLSVLATLVLVGIWYYLRRLRNRRNSPALATASTNEIYKGGNIKKRLRRSAAAAYDPRSAEQNASTDTQLDLISASDSTRGPISPIITRLRDRTREEPPSPISDPFDDSPVGSAHVSGRPLLPPSRATTFDSAYTASPISPRPSHEHVRGESMGRHTSQDALINLGAYGYESPPPISSGRVGALRLHGGEGTRYTDNDDEDAGDEDVPDLKRETLAYLSTQPGSSGIAAPREDGRGDDRDPARRAATATPAAGRRRRQGERPTEYVVHRDAGRVPNAGQPGSGRVLELPPRYEELEWDEDDPEARARQTR
jgi:hypothetical protein